MSTPSQIQANRLNAQQSTGPRTPEGKAASSQNAFKSGLDAQSQFVYGEDRADFSVLQHEYFDRFQPVTPAERFLVDTLIRNEWMLRRLFRAEAHLWEYQAMKSDCSSGVPLGEGFSNSSDVFMRMQRRVTASERSYKEAFTELGRLQSARPAPPAVSIVPEPESKSRPEPVLEPEAQQTNDQTAELGSFRKSSPSPPSDPPAGIPPICRSPRPEASPSSGSPIERTIQPETTHPDG